MQTPDAPRGGPFNTSSYYKPVPKVPRPANAWAPHVEAPLLPVRKEPVPKGGGLLYRAFCTGCLTGTKGPSEPVLMSVFLLVLVYYICVQTAYVIMLIIMLYLLRYLIYPTTILNHF